MYQYSDLGRIATGGACRLRSVAVGAFQSRAVFCHQRNKANPIDIFLPAWGVGFSVLRSCGFYPVSTDTFE